MEPHSLLTDCFKLNLAQEKALKRLSLKTVSDLLFHFPTRYYQFTESLNVKDLREGNTGVLYGTLRSLKLGKSFRKKIAMAEAVFEDKTGSIKLIWFNQPYLAKMLKENSPVRVAGKVSSRKGEIYIANPEVENVPEVPVSGKESIFGEKKTDSYAYPVYPESRGIRSGWIYYSVQKILKTGLHEKLPDPIPKEILDKYNLPSLKSALVWIHTPKREKDSFAARKRFAFEEVFYIQLSVRRERQKYETHTGYKIAPTKEEVDGFLKRFPFEATGAQHRAISAILSDFKREHPMSRLLEGDVGSGKTAVAATTAFAAVKSRTTKEPLQVAYMAPTEILATQHFESFIKYFEHLPIQIALITGSVCRKFPSKVDPSGSTAISRSQLLKWVASGEIAILLGTHALIEKKVSFRNLSYIIIDEQHRFGTKQRQKLARKADPLPHLLSMTATPIPRTLALTIYGDLDLTLLDEMPAGRKPVATEIVFPSKRKEVYEKVRRELSAGKQAYVICPRIEEPDPSKELALMAKSAKAEAKRLKKDVFPEYEIAVLHSKMKPKEKDSVMKAFNEHSIDILVATSVVEVGVNVPNATVIIIEGAERFGLAQLHQLRGRVARSTDQAYCFLFAESAGEKTEGRLKALERAKNGFELAEIDLQMRGAGELFGVRQWGVSDVGMEAIKNLKMVEAARAEAQTIIEKDPELKNLPFLKSKVESRSLQLHFE